MKTPLTFLLWAVGASASSQADTLLPRTQLFTVSAQIITGCGAVSPSGPTSGLNFGILNFGTHSAVAVGEVTVAVGDSTFQIECAPGSTLKIAIDGGLNASAGNAQRNLANSAARIAYQLYLDAGRTQPIFVGQPVSLSVSGVTMLPVYGALMLPGAGVPTGTYTDTAQVTLSF